MKTFLQLILKTLFRVKVNNISNFKEGKKLVICNHQSFLDGLLLALFLPFEATFVVHSTVLDKRLFRFVLSFVNHLAVDTTKPMAMKTVSHLINEGKSVVIFPEGRITTTGNLMKIYNGTGFIGYKTQADIVPVWIDGAVHTLFSRKHKLPRKIFSSITINIFPVEKIVLDETTPLTAKVKRKKAGEQLRKIMQQSMFLAQPKETLYQRLIRTMHLYGKKHTILWDKDQLENTKLPGLTYKDLLVRILGLGRVISKFTSEKENVGVLLPNVAVTPAIIFGLNIFNRVPSMLNYTLGRQGMQLACETAHIKTIITSRKFVEMLKDKLEPALNALTGVNIVYLEDVRKQMSLTDKMWLMLYAVRFPHKFGQAQKPEDTAVILFTSGSESVPKGVVLSNQALLANVDQCRTVIDLNPEDKVLNALPLFHSFGLTGGTLLPLLTGTPIVLYPSPLHYRIIPEVAYDKNATILFGTNTFLSQYGKNADPLDFYKMRYVVAGAEKLNDEVRNMWIEKFGIRIFEGYGATECSPVIAVNTPVFCKFGTVGHLITGMQYRLIPIAGIENGGELHIKGPNLMTGYLLHGKDGITFPHSSIGEGWYNTGDIAGVDSDSFLAIKGRTKRIIKIAGEMIPLDVVEKITYATSDKFQHACISRVDSLKGEVLVLFTTDKNLKRDAISSKAKEMGYTDLMVARDVRYIEAFPLLGTVKTDYVSLKTFL